jgi:hypothetical protein
MVLGRVTRQGREVGLPCQDMVVPAPSVGKLLRCWDRLQLLKDLDIGLRRGIATAALVLS